MKNQSVSCSRNCCQIQIGIPACGMSSEYFTRTSLYLVRLKIFEWIKFLRRHLRQIQGNYGGRNFITASRVNSRLIHYTCKNQITGLLSLLQSEDWIVGYLTSCDTYTNTIHFLTRLIFNTNKNLRKVESLWPWAC